MTPEVASTSSGTTFVVCKLAPFDLDATLLEQDLSNGKFVLGICREGCLRAQIIDADGQVLADSTSVPLGLVAPSDCVIGLRWGSGGFNAMWLNNKVIFSTDPEGLPVGSLSPTPHPKPARDFSVENRKAQSLRAHKLTNWVRNKDRVQAGPDYAFTALQGELSQVTDLLAEVEKGKHFHVPGLMSRVRLLLIGRPLGLLQFCAAFSDSQLLVYTNPDPTRLLPLEPSVRISFNGSPDRKGVWQNPIDLDAWLNLSGLQYRGKTYPHRELIREIGNTLASHLDLDVQHSVVILRSTTMRVSPTNKGIEVPIDALIKYCLMVGQMTRSLLDQTLRRAPAMFLQ